MPARPAGSERSARAPTGHGRTARWSASSARSSRRGPTPIPAPRSASGQRPMTPAHDPYNRFRRDRALGGGRPTSCTGAPALEARLTAKTDDFDRGLKRAESGFSKFGRGDRDSPGGHRQENGRPLHSTLCRRARSLPRRGVIARAAAGGTTRGSSGRACSRPGGSSRAATAATSRSKLQPPF